MGLLAVDYDYQPLPLLRYFQMLQRIILLAVELDSQQRRQKFFFKIYPFVEFFFVF